MQHFKFSCTAPLSPSKRRLVKLHDDDDDDE